MYNAISDNIFINLFLIAIMVKHNSGFFPLVLDLNNFVNIYVRYFFFFCLTKPSKGAIQEMRQLNTGLA